MFQAALTILVNGLERGGAISSGLQKRTGREDRQIRDSQEQSGSTKK
jgi:hypothetical protein